MKDILTFEKLRYSYGTNEVLHDISAEISEGKIHALFGPNGSGKSTLLKCLSGIYVPQGGSIYMQGEKYTELGYRELSRRICYVPQEHQVSFGFSVEEIVLMGRTPHLGGIRGPGKEDIEKTAYAIESIGIQDIRQKPYTELSGGQRQLVLIARALAQESPVMILDEPTSALDFRNVLTVWQTLQKLRNTGKTIIVCTHDPNHVLWFCDSVLVLKEGNIIARGSGSCLLDNELLDTMFGHICHVDGDSIRPII